jgi:TP901 family phage tail tape measure protein
VGGIKTAEAITYLRAAISNILKPTDEAKEAAKSLDISFGLTALQSKGLVGFFKELSEVTSKYKNQAEIIATLFGQEAGSGINQLIRDHGKALEEMAQKEKEAAGVTKEAVSKMDTQKMPISSSQKR